VFNVPDYCIEEVADHSISVALTIIRSIPSYASATRRGAWHWSDWNRPIRRIRGSVFGLVGFGRIAHNRIAHNMAGKLQPFGFKLIAYDPFGSESLMHAHGVKKVTLDELLRTSDLVNAMCPLNDDTHHLLDERAFSIVRKGALLVTCSRGKVVDNAALHHALLSAGSRPGRCQILAQSCPSRMQTVA
jgi:D-3-phosphoglycerate dehydrogenase